MAKYQSSMQISEKEVATALEERKKDDKGNAGTEYHYARSVRRRARRRRGRDRNTASAMPKH